MSMKDVRRSQADTINNDIWHHLHSTNVEALDVLNPQEFGLALIRKEIDTGCSPCPDILSADFGKKPSVMFISTVYGFIHKYIEQEYNRETSHWSAFTEAFYEKLISNNIGIYKRLNRIYNVVSAVNGLNPEFCFTELVKTVLIDNKSRVSGLRTDRSFLNYLTKHELPFLTKRLEQVNASCIIFTFTETSTFFTLLALTGSPDNVHIKTLPDTIEIVCPRENVAGLKFYSTPRRNGSLKINLSANGSFSRTVAFNYIFKTKSKDVYVIPLPHPSTANNAFCSSEYAWPRLEQLVSMIPLVNHC